MYQRLQSFVRLLKIRDYCLLWTAHLVSVIGDWALTAALLIFVYNLTGHKLSLSKMLIFEAMPVILFGYPAGALTDSLNRRRLMIACDVLRAGAVLMLLFVHEPTDVWIVYMVGFSIGFFGLLFRPARIASIPNIVPKDLLVTANSVATFTEICAMLLGPVIGASLAFSFMGLVCVLDAATFLLSALALWIAVIPQPVVAGRIKGVRDLWAGLRGTMFFMASNLSIRFLTTILAVVAVAVGAYNVLEVAFAKDNLRLTDSEFGLLISFLALGMFLGILICNAIAHEAHASALTAGGIALFGASLIAFSLSGSLVVALVALIPMGVGNAAALIGSTTMFQVHTPNEVQGRVVSVFWIMYTLLNCFGMYVASWVTDNLQINVAQVLLAAGCLSLIGGLAGISRLSVLQRTSLIADTSTSQVVLPDGGGD